ncbi:hypothetical protein MAPG_00940 [Magnaporthiopsis poae ATCC 64411]|uniref:Spindle pole body component n=1 Tax=Magnaporthiopsis poae (strain ATCC 64411 / 73-15) TaxID=644358 RepID=A0A0C4DMD5_MAGP6|nr:hypothetical protein MAPG_00940 [Magnaporthiopsis poae ATCC 64411]
MAHDDQSADVFAIPEFWSAPRWLQSAIPERGAGGFFDMDIDADCHRAAACVPLLPDGIISPFVNDSHVAPASAPPACAGELVEEPAPAPLPSPAPDNQDPWLSIDTPVTTATLKTWEGFLQEPGTTLSVKANANPVFITEAGPVAFDRLLASGGIPSRIHPGQDSMYLDPGQFINCLLSLAFGRGSLLFYWDSAKRSFRQTTQAALLSGYSAETLQGITATCVDCGNNARFLRSFVEKTYATHTSPCRVALATAVDKIMCSVQSGLLAKGQLARSLIQLQGLVRPLQSTVLYFRNLIVDLSRSATDEELLSKLFHAAHSAEYESDFLRATLRDVLKTVSRPWTDFVEQWLGLRPESGIPISKDGPGKGFVKVGSQLYSDGLDFELEETDFFLDEEKIPSFIPDDMVRPLFEAGRNLRFIWSRHPEHPLSRPATIASSQPPRLEWQFEWDEITRIERQAHAYEQALFESIHKGGPSSAETAGSRNMQRELAAPCSSSFDFNFFGKAEEQIQERILASIAELDKPILQPAAAKDNLGVASPERLAADGEAPSASKFTELTPHWSLLPVLSFGPIITAQARLVNRECMRLLFDVHRLAEHLKIQLDFQLLGNGLFCSRLSHALFDPDLHTAERAAGTALTGSNMGLRLLGRETWPPASSELRLALMGVLSESWEQRSKADWAGLPRNDGGDPESLPGDLSFAIRELSTEEMEKCMDPDSLEALDFLRLSYKPPTPLVPVITPMILSRYDRVFRHFLRVLRLLFVTDQLFRSAPAISAARGDETVQQRFRFEARHFVSGIAAYSFGSGIALPWRRFETWLNGVQAAVGANSLAPRASTASSSPPSSLSASGPGSGGWDDHSPERLRARHDEMLDEIMHALLLRKRQEPVLRLLEDIFTLILRFVKEQSGRRAPGPGSADVGSLYREFRRKVEVFMTVCRGLAEKGSGYGKGTTLSAAASGGASRDNPIDRLLLSLDMFDFYSSAR